MIHKTPDFEISPCTETFTESDPDWNAKSLQMRYLVGEPMARSRPRPALQWRDLRPNLGILITFVAVKRKLQSYCRLMLFQCSVI